MAIDPRISLAVQTPNIAPALNIFENALTNAQTRDIRGAQEARAAQQAPLQNQILQQQLAAGQAQASQAQDQRILKSINDFAVGNASIITNAVNSGDFKPLQGALIERRLQLQQQGLPTDQTDEAIFMIGQGGGQDVVAGLSDAVNLFNQQQGRGQTARQRELSDLTKGFSEADELTTRRIRAGLESGEGKTTADERAAIDKGLGEKIVKLEGAKAGAKEEAKLSKQLKLKPKITRAVALAKKDAESRGESLTDLKRMNAAMPGLIDVVDDLKLLAPIATSTLGGRVFDIAVKETGFGSTKGGTARSKFVATINNQVLPLLRLTFGSAFTEKEGESLKKSMSDPDSTVDSKLAQLDAFITQKRRNIEALELEVGADEQVIDFSTLSDDELFN